MWVVYSNTVRDSPPHTYTCVYSIICIYLNKINLISDSDIVLPLIMFILCMMLLELYFPLFYTAESHVITYKNSDIIMASVSSALLVTIWLTTGTADMITCGFPKAQNMILQTKTNVSDIRTYNTTQSISTNPYHPTSSDVKTVLHVI